MERIKNIKYLLRDLTVVRKKFEERERNQDNFNIFSILKKESDEVYLHSRFISSLLDPNGPHKLGAIILNSFLDIVESNFCYHDETLEVYPNNLNRNEYKNLDICFIDRAAKNAVIIENKIYHEDTNHEDKGQLENYYGRLIEEDKIPEDGIEVYYLTLDGHEPSEDSVGLSGKYPKLKDKVKCISYSVEILEWLKDIVKESYNKPSLRESIIQYIKLIENMTNNDLSIDERKEITKIIGVNEDNLLSTKLLIDNFNHVKWHTIYDFCNELESELCHQGFEILEQPAEDDITNLVHGGPIKRKIDLVFIISKENLPVWIRADFDDWLYWGVCDDKDEEIKVSKDILSKINRFLSDNNDFEKAENWSCWKFFGSNDDERICFSDFTCDGTFKLISPQYRKEVIKRLVKDIKDFIGKVMKY